jgi:hypothetical protein
MGLQARDEFVEHVIQLLYLLLWQCVHSNLECWPISEAKSVSTVMCAIDIGNSHVQAFSFLVRGCEMLDARVWNWALALISTWVMADKSCA